MANVTQNERYQMSRHTAMRKWNVDDFTKQDVERSVEEGMEPNGPMTEWNGEMECRSSKCHQWHGDITGKKNG